MSVDHLDDRQLEILGKSIGEGIAKGLLPHERLAGPHPAVLLAEVMGRAIGKELARGKVGS